jgi:hypothetical protein
MKGGKYCREIIQSWGCPAFVLVGSRMVTHGLNSREEGGWPRGWPRGGRREGRKGGRACGRTGVKSGERGMLSAKCRLFFASLVSFSAFPLDTWQSLDKTLLTIAIVHQRRASVG